MFTMINRNLAQELRLEIAKAKRDLRNVERGFFLSGEEWANSDGQAEAEEIKEIESRIAWLEHDLKIATGEIEDDNPF